MQGPTIVIGKFRRLRCALAIFIMACGFAVLSAPAAAQPANQGTAPLTTELAGSVYEFDVSAQSLETALLLFSEQAGVQLLFDPLTVANLSAKNLKGRYSLHQALAFLLDKAPLTWRIIGRHTITIEPSKGDQLAEDYLLAPIRIQGVRKEKLDGLQLKWESTVLARMRREKSYPALALQNGQEDIVYVKITVNRQGYVQVSSIIRSRHIDTLDQAALDLVKRVNPLPALPQTIAGEQYTIIVPIDYFISRTQQ
jgi:TonB family protein